MLKILKPLSLTLIVALLVGCAGLPDSLQSFGRVALDRAQTISSALALRDGYIGLKSEILINAEHFTPEEQALLSDQSAQIEAFYGRVVALSRGGTASEILVNADDFLQNLLTVRAATDRAIAIIQPKIVELNPGGAIAAAKFIGNYQGFSARLDDLLERNNRAEAVRMAAAFFKAAVPVITSLL